MKPNDIPKELHSLGDHLKKKRLSLQQFQKGVALRLGVNECTYHNWETGRTTPAIQFIPKIISFLGYTPWDGKPRTSGERLKAYRWVRGISQKEMAGLLGVDPATLARREKKGVKPSRKSLEDVVESFREEF